MRRRAATCTISSGSLSAEAALSERRQFPISLEVEEDLRGFHSAGPQQVALHHLVLHRPVHHTQYHCLLNLHQVSCCHMNNDKQMPIDKKIPATTGWMCIKFSETHLAV